MEAISNTRLRSSRPIARTITLSSTGDSHSLSPRSQSGRSRSLFQQFGSFSHVLSILIIILCLSPISSLAQPSPIANPTTVVPPSASLPGGEITTDDLHDGSSLRENTDVDHHEPERGSLERRIVAAKTDSDSAMPVPFDTLSNDFANASCVKFFSDTLKSDSVANCHPVSLLLQNSNTFFHDLASAAKTSRALDTTCSASVSDCASTMTSVAKKMLQADNCAEDYGANNTFVQGVYQDLMAYEPMYRATCLTNPDTNHYCFVDAVTNTTVPNDYNVYFIPLGDELASGNLTCDKCLEASMVIFAHWAAVDGQPLDNTYLPSAKVVNKECGANFANTSITAGTNNVHIGAGLRLSSPDFRVVSSFGLVLGVVLAGLF